MVLLMNFIRDQHTKYLLDSFNFFIILFSYIMYAQTFIIIIFAMLNVITIYFNYFS